MDCNDRKDRFPAAEFDAWAEHYDPSVTDCRTFPFEGYNELLREIVRQSQPKPGEKILDLGTGTGNLAAPFLRTGCEVWATDFSKSMLEKAGEKFPEAHFIFHDLHEPLPLELDFRFDCIVSAYVFHHFELEEKVRILQDVIPHLVTGGRVIIGDIAFPNRKEMDKVRRKIGEEWDDEIYWLADEAELAFKDAGLPVVFRQMGEYTGLILLDN